MTKDIKKERVWKKGRTTSAASLAKQRENDIVSLTMGAMGSIVGVFMLYMFNTKIANMPVPLRAPLMFVLYWAVAVIPIIIIRQDKMRPADLGFEKEGIIRQILIGIGLGLATSLVLTGIPVLAGFGEYVNSGKSYDELWKFVYEFAYCILSVGAAEELVFRGFIYSKLKSLFGKEIYAVVGSSLLFGLFHVFRGNIAQIFVTAVIGFIFCTYKNKIKGCTLLSLMICHGVYDAMITVWALYK
ncbi:CPBP family intramembrane glutamic endopeptidase [Ruminococcus albus]|uniref:Abortive infection protein n=1 Tax=Ruminococcus albus (strain ATCC 27210 / DSM 20455 / JCM 14654 / NCDO 2250 / 7) TaxID=697329 RepID=E6UDJ2_RUMA7|nr:CPBP family intramembrane glutamic endopeptidase [Ruminococcus albus]ADU23453.1 Abortive infection protein [Ruminococcus albus 7 = DSM 20455]